MLELSCRGLPEVSDYQEALIESIDLENKNLQLMRLPETLEMQRQKFHAQLSAMEIINQEEKISTIPMDQYLLSLYTNAIIEASFYELQDIKLLT